MNINNIDFKKNNGLVPAIVQECVSGDVLMLGYMNKESLEKTKETGRVHFWSRTRKKNFGKKVKRLEIF